MDEAESSGNRERDEERETDLRYIYKVELTGLHEGFVREGGELVRGRNQNAFPFMSTKMNGCLVFV